MAITGNGTTGNIITAASIAPPSRYTFHFLYRNVAAPGTATVQKPFSITNGTSDYDVSFCWDHTASPRTLFHRRSGGTYDQATIPAGVLTSNTWYAIGGRYDGTTLSIWVNGVLQSSIGAADPTNTVNPTPTALAGSAGTSNFDDGTIAEVGVWNVALTDSEMLSLGDYFTPSQVRPESLIWYVPLIRSIVAIFGSVSSSGGLTVADHPRIFEGFGGQTRRFTADATYTVDCSGGVSFAGDSTVAPDFVIPCSGGITFSGDSPIMIGVSFTSTMNFGAAIDPTHLRDTVHFGNTFATPTQFGNFTSGVFFHSSFQSDSGFLASGRETDRLD